MSAKQLDLIQGSPEWHVWRATGIGASDAAALFGKSPYKTKRDLFFEKSGFGQPDDEDRSYIYQRGHDTEDDIRSAFSDLTGIEVKPTCFENGIFLASLDGFDKRLGILEAKLVGKDVLAKIAKGETPEHHRIQVQSQLYSSEADKAFYAARAPGVKKGHVVEIGRDETLIKEIIEAGEELWAAIQSGDVPSLSAGDTLFITDPTEIAIFKRLTELRAQKELIEAAYDEAEKLAKALAVHSRVRCGNIAITEVEKRGSVDYKKIPEVKAMAEEYLEQFRGKTSVYKMLRFVKGA